MRLARSIAAPSCGKLQTGMRRVRPADLTVHRQSNPRSRRSTVRWVTVATEQGPRACGVVHERYVDLNGADPQMPSSMRELLGLAPDQQRKAWSLLDRGTLSYEPAKTRLLAPVPDPRKIICIGLNYRDHAAESGVPVPPEPVLFSKYPTTLIGHLDRIVLPRVSQRGGLRGRAGDRHRPGRKAHLSAECPRPRRRLHGWPRRLGARLAAQEAGQAMDGRQDVRHVRSHWARAGHAR